MKRSNDDQIELVTIDRDAIVTGVHDEVEIAAQTIFELFETLPLDRAMAVLEGLKESIEDNDYADDDIPFPIAWVDGEPVYRQ